MGCTVSGTYPAGAGTRRPPPGLPNISSSSRSELSGVGLGTPILRRRLWGDSWGRRGLWGARAAGGACPGRGAESGAVKRGCAEPSRAGAANSPPSSRRSSRPPQLGRPVPAAPRCPAPPPPRPAPGRRLGQTSTLMVAPPLASGWANWRHLGSSTPISSLRGHPALHLPAFPGEWGVCRASGDA